MIKSSLSLLFVYGSALAAQSPPGTDIYVMSFAAGGATATIGKPVNITARAGYDNQPFFSPDGKSVYYTSNRGAQTDIYRFDLGPGTSTQITRTPENEYSPTIMPDGKQFVVVMTIPQATPPQRSNLQFEFVQNWLEELKQRVPIK